MVFEARGGCQNGAKIYQKIDPGPWPPPWPLPGFILVAFWVDFGVIWGRFWCTFGLIGEFPLGPPETPKQAQMRGSAVNRPLGVVNNNKHPLNLPLR